jgi:endonuclease YncB( thermonuclease family)
MKWDSTLNLIVILLFVFLPLPARAESLIFQQAIAGDAFQASGRVITLYGVEPPAPSDPNAYAATLFLDTVLAHASLDCRTVPGTPRMACKANGADVASQIVRMGMGRSAAPAYTAEQADAQLHRRGIWRGQSIPAHNRFSWREFGLPF